MPPPGFGEPAAPGQEELMKQLRLFLQGATSGGRSSPSPRLAGTALHLLTHLPAARDAVFEYYAGVLDSVVARYNTPHGGDGGVGLAAEEEEKIVFDLQRTLSGFIENNPKAWAPVVSKWALDSLGKLSSKYSNKICGKQSSSAGFGLNEKLSAWLGCSAARSLLELAAECLAKLMHDETESCVAALLDTSVRHTPHFDWVVAHVGSCFPHTVIKRVLSVGQKDFAVHAAGQVAQDGSVNLSKVPKLMSIINILSHLALTHQADLQASVHTLLLSSLDSPAQSTSTVPYLLHLASSSTPLRRALTADLASKLTPEVLRKVADLAPTWVSNFFPAGNSLLNLATHLLQSTDQGGPPLLVLLLEQGREDAGPVAKYSRLIVHLLLCEIFQQVHGVMRHRTDEVPVFSGFGDSLPVFMKFLLSDNIFQVQAATQLTALFALHKGRSVSVHVVKYILFSARDDHHLGVLTELLKQIEIFHFNCVTDAVSQALRSRDADQHLIRNLNKLATQELNRQDDLDPPYRSSFCQAIRQNHSHLADKLCQRELTDLILHLFVLVPPQPKMRVLLLHKLCHCLVHTIFLTVSDHDLDEGTQARHLNLCETVLTALISDNPGDESSVHTAGLQIALRFMLDACISSPFSIDLGGQPETGENPEASVRQRQTASLLKENLKFGSMPVQPLAAATVFHAGVIGSGARPPTPEPPISREKAQVNRRSVTGIVVRLCEMAPGGISEGSKQLALLLVEVVSPDIMYNGLPWPEEDFMKVTVERDLAITRLLDRHPVVWELLELLAGTRPALCYCSVLVRAVVAVSISYWQSNASNSSRDNPRQLETTRKVLQLMSLGQFLPPQLSVVQQILDVMDPFQLYCVLIDIWNFMKMNVPGPNLYELNETGLACRSFGPYKNYKVFCDRLRLVMVKNIDKVADLFKKNFIDAAREGENGHVETL